MDAVVLSVKAFSDRLLKKSPKDYVYVRLLKNVHGRQKHTEEEWKTLLDGMRRTPAFKAQ
jgi:hypothetical protein